MKIDHVRFCVEDAKTLSQWFASRLGFCVTEIGEWNGSHTEIVHADSIVFVISSPLVASSPAAGFLRQHPPGVSDVVLKVDDFEQALNHAIAQGATLQHSPQTEYYPQGCLKWATLTAWGSLTHTLVERSGITPLMPSDLSVGSTKQPPHTAMFSLSQTTVVEPTAFAVPGTPEVQFAGIDHVVINVPQGDLAKTVSWYQRVLQLQPQQMFEIQTQHSGLCSQVMRHPSGAVQLPINEPASPNSQIQEFLDVNRGAGVQHIALETVDLLQAIAQFRTAGLPLIQVPSTYYTQLRDRACLPFSAETLQALEAQQVLADWQTTNPDAGVLLQTFTQPIFKQPTFFLELIERQTHPLAGQPHRAAGFGEGNFQALFEAIEREQIKRGSLTAINAGNC